jgi:homoserine O-acetyltransferase
LPTVELFRDEPLRLECGQTLGPIRVAYEEWGPRAAPTILVCHALTGWPEAASTPRRAGWWDAVVGPGRPVDTDRFHVICQNVLGGCYGTTGPADRAPDGRPWGLRFPVITVPDMVRVQYELLARLDSLPLHAVIGGSLGGMQALEWAIRYPDATARAVVIGATGAMHAQGIAFDAVMREAIFADPRWRDGLYEDGEGPERGLALARWVGMITYRGLESMEAQFGRRLRGAADPFRMEPAFAVETYLAHHGQKLVERFDARSYVYLTKAMDLMDVARTYGSEEAAYRRIRARLLVVGIHSDVLFPERVVRAFAERLAAAGVDVRYLEQASDFGHDAFLVEPEAWESDLRRFLTDDG